MLHSDFKIGLEFETDVGRWRCTDVGARTVVAILIDRPGHLLSMVMPKRTDASWFNGPPYAVPEQVFDENDLPACRPIQ